MSDMCGCWAAQVWLVYTAMCCECAIRNSFGRLGRKKTVHQHLLTVFSSGTRGNENMFMYSVT